MGECGELTPWVPCPQSRSALSSSSSPSAGASTPSLAQQQFFASHQSTSTAAADQRSSEIADIAQSIADLADLFKDLSSLVIDQGTLLDRVDWNVEVMSTEVRGAAQELREATRCVERARFSCSRPREVGSTDPRALFLSLLSSPRSPRPPTLPLPRRRQQVPAPLGQVPAHLPPRPPRRRRLCRPPLPPAARLALESGRRQGDDRAGRAGDQRQTRRTTTGARRARGAESARR